ncbi:hypothetical protein HUJ05_012313 [Dendroctonus ponderosae]|nr:hypothetical protein HUJ05_012313 [Dendroctonus ponderosae]
MLRRKLFESPSHPKGASEDQNSELFASSLETRRSEQVSRFFPGGQDAAPAKSLADAFLEIQTNLNMRLNQIDFVKPPVHYVYNPTEYAHIPHELYHKKYCSARKPLLLVGMNPGPNGMCQTGVPFGDPNWVRNWLQIEGSVSKPATECPKRLVQGFRSARKEPSGDKFWGFWAARCGTAASFFQNAFVHNYCPLAFMESSGRNVTPSDMKFQEERKALESACDTHYLEVIKLMRPEKIVAIGRYIEKRTLTVLKRAHLNVKVLCLPHPSPRTALTMETSSKALLEEEQMFMEKAFAFAKEALDNQEVPVGCIFVYEKEVVAVGRNEVNESKNATRHAEMICIDHVTKYYKDNQLELKEVFRKIDIYVTVEPCIMCAAALYDLSVRSVTFGCKNDRFGGSTVLDVAQVLKPSTLIKGGYKADEAMQLLKDFYKGQNPNAPAAKVKKKY